MDGWGGMRGLVFSSSLLFALMQKVTKRSRTNECSAICSAHGTPPNPLKGAFVESSCFGDCFIIVCKPS